MDWSAAILTLKLAALSTGILLLLGLPLAYWLATTKWRFSFIVEALVTLPIVLPPTVLGFYLLVAMSQTNPAGRLFQSLAGFSLPFTFAGILVGATIFNMPFAIRPFVSAFASVDRKLIEESWCLGVSKAGTLLKVVVPMAWPGILTGLILSFAHTIGEFGVVLMLGGNIPGVTRTISIAIYDQAQAMDYAAANRMALVLMGVSFAALCATYALQRKSMPL